MENINSISALNELSSLKTLAEMFARRVAQSPNAEAYREFDVASGNWLGTSWQQISERVSVYIRALSKLNLERGARVAILLPNGTSAVCIDQATLAMACVPVPMHALDNPESIAYILNDSDASLLVVDTDQQWQDIVGTGLKLPGLKQVVIAKKVLAGQGEQGDIPVELLDTWLALAVDFVPTMRTPDESELAALVYTSGTTGKPKGVMLTHLNVMSNVKSVVERVAPVMSDVFLSFLPLSHTFERTAGYYLPVATGSCVAYSRSTKQLAQDLIDVKPTILISVPRIYERIYGIIQTKLSASNVQSGLFNAAIEIGWRRFCRDQGMPEGNAVTAILDAIGWVFLQPLIAQKLLDQFGGRLRVAVSGGAALSPVISRCFLGLGIPIVQGYGMTETSPVIAVNTPDDNNPATVGRVLSRIEVRIGENAELQVRGPNVMRGYWKREEDTAKAFIDGWLRTGDQAEIVDGRVQIKGRIKEIIVTSTGEKIAPVDLELAILTDVVFEQAYVFGENLPFIGCAVVLSKTYWNELANSLQLNPNNLDELNSPRAVEIVVARIREKTSSFPYYAQPKSVILSLESWTIENSLITPTLKLKRKNLAAYFATGIEQMYKVNQNSKRK
jgi:long-chain acyl-CoA synthetase